MADPSQLVLMNAGTVVRCRHLGCRGRACATTLHLDEKLVGRLAVVLGLAFPGGRPFPKPLLAASPAVAYALHVMLAATRDSAGAPLLPTGFAGAAVNLAIVAAFARVFRPAGHGPSSCLRLSELARRAREVLVSRATESISLGEIARELGRSHHHLCRVFKAEVGITTHQYLHRVRIHEALHRLGDGEEDLLALALDLGYSSHSHFTRFFHRLVGAPPSQVWGRIENGAAASARAGEERRKVARSLEWLGQL